MDESVHATTSEKLLDSQRTDGALVYDAIIDKTDSGFGIYFARQTLETGDMLVVDGFVDEQPVDGRDDDGLRLLQLGDILVAINGTECAAMEVADIVALLRSAPSGPNTLHFQRPACEESTQHNEDEETKAHRASIAGSFMGALRKVKHKLKTEIEGDEKEARREQEEIERFEQQWLAEFDRLKSEYAVKWATCTYTADDFCGKIYRSSDVQQRAHLAQEYPTIMEAWKDDQIGSKAPGSWTPAIAVCAEAIEYTAAAPVVDSERGGTDSEHPLPRQIDSPPAFYAALQILQRDFMWRPTHVAAFSRRLEDLGICSCSDLVDAIETGAASCQFERRTQSKDFPRLTKSICRALQASADKAARHHEVARAEASDPILVEKWRPREGGDRVRAVSAV